MIHLQLGFPAPDFKDINNILAAQRVFSPEECDDLLHLARPEVPFARNNIQGVFAEPDVISASLVNKLKSLLIKANKKFGLDLMVLRDFHLLELKEGEECGWFNDFTGDEYSTTRKLTFMLFLSPEDGYSGGEITFFPANSGFDKGQGSIIIFPSFFIYKFSPVLNGSSKIFFCWACGNALR